MLVWRELVWEWFVNDGWLLIPFLNSTTSIGSGKLNLVLTDLKVKQSVKNYIMVIKVIMPTVKPTFVGIVACRSCCLPQPLSYPLE